MAITINGSTGIVEANLADNAITANKIASDAVTVNKIASDAVTSAKIATGAVAAADLASGAARANFGAGAVLQILSSVKTDTGAWSGATWIDVNGLSITITPSSASSKFLVFFSVCLGQDLQHHQASGRLVRNGNLIFVADAAGNRERCTFGSQDSGAIHGATYNYAGQFLDSPATASALTYKIQVRGEGGTTWINRGAEADGDNAVTQRLASSITVMEIAG